MSSPRLHSNRGVTLVELLVSLAITAILLVMVVSGTLFVQRYVERWRRQNSRAEEVAFAAQLLSEHMASCTSIARYPDSIVFFDSAKERACYRWPDGQLQSDRQILLQPGYSFEHLAITPFPLPQESPDTILRAAQVTRPGLYFVRFAISDRSAADTCALLVRNFHEYYQYAPPPADQ